MRQLSTVAELRALMQKSNAGDTVLFKVRRNGRLRYVGVPLTH